MNHKGSLKDNPIFRFIVFAILGIFASWGEFMNRLDVISEELKAEYAKPDVKKKFTDNGLLQLDATKVVAGSVAIFTIATCISILFGFQNPVSIEKFLRIAGGQFVGLVVVNTLLALAYRKRMEVRQNGLSRLDFWLMLEALAIFVSASCTFFVACYLFYMLSP